MIRPIKKQNKSIKEYAQTMVEFALVFPIVLLITYGIMEFGRMVFIYAAVTGSAREGARYGAAAGSLSTSYYMDCAGIRDAARRGAILVPISDANISIWFDSGPGTNHIPVSGQNICPPVDSNGFDMLKLGDRVGVQVQVQYKPIIDFLGLDKAGFLITSESARTILMNVQMLP